jgi:hypothetical protein
MRNRIFSDAFSKNFFRQCSKCLETYHTDQKHSKICSDCKSSENNTISSKTHYKFCKRCGEPKEISTKYGKFCDECNEEIEEGRKKTLIRKPKPVYINSDILSRNKTLGPYCKFCYSTEHLNYTGKGYVCDKCLNKSREKWKTPNPRELLE